jgi:hypothetical protein
VSRSTGGLGLTNRLNFDETTYARDPTSAEMIFPPEGLKVPRRPGSSAEFVSSSKQGNGMREGGGAEALAMATLTELMLEEGFPTEPWRDAKGESRVGDVVRYLTTIGEHLFKK